MNIDKKIVINHLILENINSFGDSIDKDKFISFVFSFLDKCPLDVQYDELYFFFNIYKRIGSSSDLEYNNFEIPLWMREFGTSSLKDLLLVVDVLSEFLLNKPKKHILSMMEEVIYEYSSLY